MMKTGTKIAIVVTAIAVVVPLVGYFIFKGMKSRLEKDREKEKIDTAKLLKEFDNESKSNRQSLSKPPTQLIPNTQPMGFGAQLGGFGKPNLTNRPSSSIYQPLNLNIPKRV